MISIILFFILQHYWKKTKFTVVIKNKALFYMLQWMWGILTNIAGALMTLVLTVKYKPQKYGRCVATQLPVNWGLSLGMFVFGEISCLPHEHGHAFQNALLGPFFLTVVALPSVIRFWIRKIQYNIGKPPKDAYDDLWIEGQATQTGKKYFEQA